MLGLRVISVSEFLERRLDTDPEPNVLAVRGWYTPPLPLPCPSPQTPQALLEPSCGDDTTWLAEGREPEVAWGAGGWSADPPVGPAIHPKVIGPTTVASWMPDSTWEGHPFRVVLLGHIGDERAEVCPPETLALCRRTFVVDRFAWVADVELPVGLVDITVDAGLGARPTATDVEAMVAAVLPGATMLSRAILPADTIRTIEPTLGYDRRQQAVYVRVMGNPCPGLDYGPKRHRSLPLVFTLAGEVVHRPACPESSEPAIETLLPTNE